MTTTLRPHFFYEKKRDGLYLISCPEWETEKSTINSWLIIGKEFAVLVDAGLPSGKGLRAFVENLAKKPVRLVLSHGHFDHTGFLDEFDDFWIHPMDKPMLSEGIHSRPYHGRVHPVLPGEVWDLGDRLVKILGVAGHTKGSLLLLDKNSKILIAGDSVARRIFYDSEAEIPITTFFEGLLKLDEEDYEFVASAHDRCLLPKKQNHLIIQSICDGIEAETPIWDFAGTKYFTIKVGDGPEDPQYFSCSMEVERKEFIARAIKEWKRGRSQID